MNIELRTLNSYQQELKAKLPPEIFARTPWRILYFFSFLAINISLVYFVVHYDPAWYLKLLAAFIIGQLAGSLSLFAHEVLHGSIFKSKFIQDAIAFVCYTPFLLSPTYWRFWHNGLHHGNTQLIYKDPDAFPTLSVYKRSRFMRAIFRLSPGSKNVLSYLYLFYWFSFQALINQFHFRFKNKMWDKMDHARVWKELIPMCLVAGGYVYWVGAANFLYLVLIPFCLMNYVILSYIVTNHNMSPLTKVNDPMVNSLTVTTGKFWSFIHLNFGYHVEHHLFPRVSCKHAKKLHVLCKEMYPEQYQSMPKWKALKHLYLTPRIYKSSDMLIHPKSLKTYSTL